MRKLLELLLRRRRRVEVHVCWHHGDDAEPCDPGDLARFYR